MPAQSPDYLYAFTGLRTDQLTAALGNLLAGQNALQARGTHYLTHRRAESLSGFTLAAALAFYRAEHGANPKINTLIDAIYYITTCLTVGYADIFPVTQNGRLIASLVMTAGPALSANLLDPPAKG